MYGKEYLFKFLTETEYLPDQYEPGIVYISNYFMCAAFICPCGCNDQVYLRINCPEHPSWSFDGKNTLEPSIQKTTGCKAHFYIKQGKATLA